MAKIDLRKKLAELKAELEQAMANAHALSGAVQLCEQLIAAEETADVQSVLVSDTQ